MRLQPPHEIGAYEKDNWSEIESCQLPNNKPLRSAQYCKEELGEERPYSHDPDVRALCLPPQFEDAFLESDFDLVEMLDQEEEMDNLRQSYSHVYSEFSGEGVESGEIRFSTASQSKSRANETIFVVQDAKTNWGECTRPRYADKDNEVSSRSD